MKLKCYENQTENRTRLRTHLNQVNFIEVIELGYQGRLDQNKKNPFWRVLDNHMGS